MKDKLVELRVEKEVTVERMHPMLEKRNTLTYGRLFLDRSVSSFEVRVLARRRCSSGRGSWTTSSSPDHEERVLTATMKQSEKDLRGCPVVRSLQHKGMDCRDCLFHVAALYKDNRGIYAFRIRDSGDRIKATSITRRRNAPSYLTSSHYDTTCAGTLELKRLTFPCSGHPTTAPVCM